MHKLCEYIDDELMELERKVGKGQKLNASEVQYGDMLAHFKKSLLTSDAMESGGSYGRGSYERGSYNRGGSYNRSYDDKMESYARRRDSMGRYSSDGYSRADEMVSELHRLMESAPDDRTRQEFKRFISKIETM